VPELDLSIVIPAYKEAAKIETDIRAAAAFIDEMQLSGEIVVVDDGSPDATASAARSLMPEFPQLRVLSYLPNRGKGHALRFGMTRATGNIILFADSGLCVPYNVARLPLTMLGLKMCDIAHGSRRIPGSTVKAQPLFRRLGSRAVKFFVHTAMGIPLYISDTQCGFKAYRREVAHELYGAAFTDGFMYDTEIILRALKAKLRILEFPVIWSNDADSRFDPLKGTIPLLIQLVNIRLGLLRPEAAKAAALAPVVER